MDEQGLLPKGKVFKAEKQKIVITRGIFFCISVWKLMELVYLHTDILYSEIFERKYKRSK